MNVRIPVWEIAISGQRRWKWQRFASTEFKSSNNFNVDSAVCERPLRDVPLSPLSGKANK